MVAFVGGTFQVHRRLKKCAVLGRNCVVLGVIMEVIVVILARRVGRKLERAPIFTIWTPREPKVPKMCVLLDFGLKKGVLFEVILEHCF